MMYLYYNSETGEMQSLSLFIQWKNKNPFIEIETCPFHKPKVNLETLEVYESATAEEIAELTKQITPSELTILQFSRALFDLYQIDDYFMFGFFEILPDYLKPIVKITWIKSTKIERNDAMLIMLVPALNIYLEMLNIDKVVNLDEIFTHGFNL